MNKEPFISDDLIEFLEKSFQVDDLLQNLSGSGETPEESFGYLKGVRTVIYTLKGVARRQKEELEDL